MTDTVTRHLDPYLAPGGRRQHVAVVWFGTWMITGLFLDGWSHNHHRPETFFTPWHAVLYSGFVAAVLWFVWDGWRHGANQVVATDRLTAAGLVLFGAAAVGDFGWHQVFGIERSISALLSPTHLLLMSGGLLMVTEPFRGAARTIHDRTPAWRTLAPAVLSLTLATAVVAFFFMYLSPVRGQFANEFVVRGPEGSFLVERAEMIGIASVLITNVLLIGAVLLAVRHWKTPPGAFTLLFTVVALATSGLDTFQRLPLALAVITGGVVADVLVTRGLADRSHTSLRVLAGLVPAAAWLPYFAVFKLDYHLPWSIHLWLGTVFMAALTGIGLSLLAAPPGRPAAP